jgi:hypothetical protein
MTELMRVPGLQVFDHGQTQTPEGLFTIHAIAEPPTIRSLEDAGYAVRVLEDVDEIGKQRQKEVGLGNRFLKQ